MKKNILAIMALIALVIPFGVDTSAVQLVHAQATTPKISYVGNILDIPRLPAFGGYTSEGGSFIGGVTYITDIEWMPGSDGEGYFVITSSVAEQLGPNAYKFGLWVFSDEGEQLAQINIEDFAGNTSSDTGHLGSKNTEIRELGDDMIIIETYAYGGDIVPNGLFVYRIGGFTGASIVASKALPGGSGGLNEAITYYTDDYILAPSGGATSNSPHVLYDTSLNPLVVFPGNPFSNDGETRYSRAPSIGNYLFASRRRANTGLGGGEAPEAYKFTNQGIEEVEIDFEGHTAFVYPTLVGEDQRTGGKWIITGIGSSQNPREELLLLVPGENELVIEKKFSLKSGVFADTLVPHGLDRRLSSLSATGDFLFIPVWDVDGTGSVEIGFGTHRLFIFNYKTEELVFSGILDKHRKGGPSEGVPHPSTGVPIILHPDAVGPVKRSAISPNGLLAVGDEDRVYLYKIENIDFLSTAGGDGTDPGNGGQTQQDAPSFEYLYEFTTLYMKLVQDLMRGSINLDTVRGLNSSTRESGTRDAVGGSGRGSDSINRIFDFLRF